MLSPALTSLRFCSVAGGPRARSTPPEEKVGRTESSHLLSINAQILSRYWRLSDAPGLLEENGMRITQPHRRVAGKVHGFLPAIRMNPPATIETYADATRFGQTGCLIGSERRRNLRIPLHWTVYLASKGSGCLLRPTTRD